MIDEDIQKALNAQLNEEQTASQEYLAMAAWLEDHNWKGFAAFMRRQSDEERTHAMRFFDHIVDRGGSVKVEAIRAPRGEFSSPLDIFKAALERERANSRSINKCYSIAIEKKDYPSQPFLHSFINEQVEEEAWAEEAVGLLETAGDSGSALIMLDNRYATLQTES